MEGGDFRVEDGHKIEMATDVDSTSAPQVQDETLYQFRWPSFHLLSGLFFDVCVPLYNAALKGDWETAKGIIRDDPRSILCASITKGYETALHIGAGARQTDFVKKLVDLMKPKDLALQDRNGNTAFCFAAAAGAVQIAKIMMKKNRNLPTIRGGKNMTPLYMAALFGHIDMALFLYPETRSVLTKEDRIGLFFTCIDTGVYDLTLKLLEDYSELAIARDVNHDTALHILARKPLSAFAVKSPGVWKRFINSSIKFTHNKYLAQTQALQLVKCLWENLLIREDLDIIDLIRKPSQLLFEAAKLGNFELLVVMIHSYPDLVWEVDENNRSIFHVAVLHRHANIFNLIHEIGSAKDVIGTYVDSDGNNILHLAAKLPHPYQLDTISGEVQYMQRELLWFKEVKKILQPSFRQLRNCEGRTPQELFTMEHTRLLRNGELSIKKTASSCVLVATLIATTVFAKAFGIPGHHIHLKENLFWAFNILNAVALFSSSTSVLLFLSILISPSVENDFLKSLRFKAMVGLSTLLVSFLTMVVAFSVTFFY